MLQIMYSYQCYIVPIEYSVTLNCVKMQPKCARELTYINRKNSSISLKNQTQYAAHSIFTLLLDDPGVIHTNPLVP